MNTTCRRVISSLMVICLVLSAIVLPPVGVHAASAKKPLYIAHRGLSAKAPENTLASFALASKYKNFYGIEFDVWESEAENDNSDPLLLVMHDSTTKRMCGIKANVQSITRANLGKYVIKKGKNIKKYKGQTIPTIEQTLDTIWKNSKGAIPVIELKHRLSPRALDYLLTCLGNHRAVIISFEFDAITDTIQMAEAKGIKDNIKTMYLMNKLSSKKYSSTAARLDASGIDCISLKYTTINKNSSRPSTTRASRYVRGQSRVNLKLANMQKWGSIISQATASSGERIISGNSTRKNSLTGTVPISTHYIIAAVSVALHMLLLFSP